MHHISIFLVLSLSLTSYADECTRIWEPTFETNPLTPKGHSGDTSAAYMGTLFNGDPTLKFVIKARFPKARFMSLETYQTRLSQKVDSILDYQIEPDEGSDNPFRDGVEIGTVNRSFTLNIVPESFDKGEPNTLRLPENNRLHSFLYRIYAPHDGVKLTPSDLPRIFAFDARTGVPRTCPQTVPAWVFLDLPQLIFAPILRWPSFFLRELKLFSIGTNEAIPHYLFRYNRVFKGADVAIIRFKAPTFLNSQSGKGSFKSNEAETRYWSSCFQNVAKNITLACLPDYQAKLDFQGNVTLVYGTGNGVRRMAESRGYNFIEDSRTPDQKVLGMLYRNILPSHDFKDRMYINEYQPRGILCDRNAFLSSACGR